MGYLKNCSTFDELWDKPTYDYCIPEGSFCAGYTSGVSCIMSDGEPHFVECHVDDAPTIHFYFDKKDNCDVIGRYGINKDTNDSKNNENCIERVRNHFVESDKTESKLVYLTHGFDSNENPDHWLYHLKDALISRYAKGIIIVGVVFWTKGARWVNFNETIPASDDISRRADVDEKIEDHMGLICCFAKLMPSVYTRYGIAAITTWGIGNILGYIHESILGGKDSDLHVKTYCIGHSLGSHVCGFFGKMMKRLTASDDYYLEKIIGLDPAGPLFHYEDHEFDLRLNKNDARIVEVFHTNTLRLGFKKPIGDIDFYINGGKSQYWCNEPESDFKLLLQAMWDQDGSVFTCAHEYAWDFLNLLAISMMPCYARWKTANATSPTPHNAVKFGSRIGGKLLDGSQAKVFYPGHLDNSLEHDIPLGKHYLYINPKDSKECKYRHILFPS